MANDKKKGLGRGLGALMGGMTPSSALSGSTPAQPAVAPAVPAAPTTLADGTRLIEIDPTELKPNPKQPRLVFDEEALAELAESIRRDGVQEPVIVREAAGGGYELVSGERRVRASVMADRALIPAVVRDISDSDLLRLGLIENIQRENLNPIETSKAYGQLMEEFGWTQERLAEEVGKKRATVANALRLLQLAERVQDQVSTGAISAGHAKLLAGLAHDADQVRIANKIVAEGLSVRQTETLIAQLNMPKAQPRSTPRPAAKDPNVGQVEDDLRRKFGRKAAVKASEEGKGSIELQFFSWDDFEVLLQQLKSIK